ncbi:MAG: CRISPR-associated protein Cas4 [Tepidisphaeraceae bacterium]|jgi:CRISPR-associated exonuclease Cas4
MFSEDDLLPISALQHLLYCPRQCALIHLEQLWAENSLTVQGKHLHERADSGKSECRDGVRTVRSLPLRSLKWGLIGKADIVEFRVESVGERCFPVEYKRGKPKAHDADRVQLCAQALCLEEMLGVMVSAGALFYGKTRRRLDVAFDESLRNLTAQTIARLHELIAARITPSAIYEKAKCERCSLMDLCMPKAGSCSSGAGKYLDYALTRTLATGAMSD